MVVQTNFHERGSQSEIGQTSLMLQAAIMVVAWAFRSISGAINRCYRANLLESDLSQLIYPDLYF